MSHLKPKVEQVEVLKLTKYHHSRTNTAIEPVVRFEELEESESGSFALPKLRDNFFIRMDREK